MSLALGVLASGRGSNLQAILDACARPGFPAHVAVVISDRERSVALERARAAGVEALWVNPKDFADREAFDLALVHELQAAVPVEPADTEDTLAARILVQEHRLYPEAIWLFAEGRLQIQGRRVIVLPEAPG